MPTLLRRRAVCAAAFAALVAAIGLQSAAAQAPLAPAPRPVAATGTVPVAMFIDSGVGGKGPEMMEERFHGGTEFRITRVNGADVRAGKLKNYKVLVVPGGSGSKEGAALGAEGREEVRKFVDGGGTYVGICAGCYLATCNYDWSLHILPVKVVDRANWMRGKANLRLELTPDGKQWTARPDATVTTIYHNGPVLEPVANAGQKLVPLAVYREEITKKGAKEGLMVNTPAIAAARYGKGWAVGVSPHPEQTTGLKDIVPAVIRWTLSHPLEK